MHANAYYTAAVDYVAYAEVSSGVGIQSIYLFLSTTTHASYGQFDFSFSPIIQA